MADKNKKEEYKMVSVALLLISLGIVLVIAGIFWLFFGKIVHLGSLPGDFEIVNGNLKIYFPLATCIILSVLFSVVYFVLRLFFR